jgi:hypothetical protein
LARRGGTGRPRRVASTREVVHEDVESGPSVYTRAVGWVYVRKELVFLFAETFFIFLVLHNSPPYPLLKTYDRRSGVRGKASLIWVRKVFQFVRDQYFLKNTTDF